MWQNHLKPGWRLGLDMEPLVWGYGLNGGYLLGQASRPFPKLLAESPMAPRSLWKVPLGTWGLQVFMGRLEKDRAFSDSMQNRLAQEALASQAGDVQNPLVNGYRVQAEFSDFMEFYANYLNMWGGTRNGQSMFSGYGIKDFATAMFGFKDTLAESNIDPNHDATSQNNAYANKALSSSNADVGFRVRSRPLERMLDAESVYGYFSRGSKSVGSSFSLLAGNPVKYVGKDLHSEWVRASRLGVGRIWRETGRYTAPNLTSPNETVGVLVAWPRLRIGLEYLDAINVYGPGKAQVRPWNNSIYQSGFYTYGDPLGNAIAGEARTATLRLECEFAPAWSGTTLVHRGQSPFRDALDLWQADHPGLTPDTDRFLGMEQNLVWRAGRGVTLSAGGAWARHSAVDNVPGASKNGVRWYADLGFRWPAPVR
jgi:hypothetical protein